MYRRVGVVGVVPIFLAAKIKDMASTSTMADATNTTNAEHALAVSAICDEYLTALMLSGAHCEHFGEFCMNLKNQFSYSDNGYLKTLDACLSLLNCWMPSTHQKSLHVPRPLTATNPAKDKDEDEALVFAQDAKKLLVVLVLLYRTILLPAKDPA
jgi:hypothetical protein